MKIALCLTLALIGFSALAQTPAPAHLPGEPHHELKIDNPYVRAYYVVVAPHEATQLHRHDFDYIFVSLGPSDIINAPQGKPELHQVLRDAEIHFARGGLVHVARNLSEKPFRNVTIEFLKPQGEIHNLCEKIVDGPLGDCHPSRNASQAMTPLLETEELLLELSFLNAKAAFGGVSRYGRLIVALDQSELEIRVPEKPPVMLRSGEMLWLPAGRPATIKNPAGGPSGYISVLFKDSDNSAQP